MISLLRKRKTPENVYEELFDFESKATEEPVTEDFKDVFRLYELPEAVLNHTGIEDGYSLNYVESRYPYNPITNRYEKEYYISLNTRYSIEIYSDIGTVERLIESELKGGLFYQFGITGYIDDYDRLNRFLKTHPEEIIASSIRISCSEWSNQWEVAFFVNKPVNIPNYLIAGSIQKKTTNELISAI